MKYGLEEVLKETSEFICERCAAREKDIKTGYWICPMDFCMDEEACVHFKLNMSIEGRLLKLEDWIDEKIRKALS